MSRILRQVHNRAGDYAGWTDEDLIVGDTR